MKEYNRLIEIIMTNKNYEELTPEMKKAIKWCQNQKKKLKKQINNT